MKRSAGFTLIELIVVIAILAILAGVDIPSYTGYVLRAEDTGVLVSLRGILTAVQAANINGNDITKIEVSESGKRITISVTDGTNGLDAEFNARFCSMYGCSIERNDVGVIQSAEVIVNLEHSAYKKGAVWYASDDIAPEGDRNGWNPMR